MLTIHPIAAINCTEHVAGQLRSLFFLTIVFLLCESCLSHGTESFLGVINFLQSFNHIVDWVKSSRAIITHEHSCAPTVALGEDLGAAATSALPIHLTDQLIA